MRGSGGEGGLPATANSSLCSGTPLGTGHLPTLGRMHLGDWQKKKNKKSRVGEN